MIAVYEVSGVNRRTRLAEFNNFEQAMTYVLGMNPILVEEDKDNPGCADAFLADMRILAVETES